MSVITEIFRALLESFDRAFWDFRGVLYDYDTYKMLEHPQDRANYLAALDKIRNGSKSETFVLHTGKQVTLSTSR